MRKGEIGILELAKRIKDEDRFNEREDEFCDNEMCLANGKCTCYDADTSHKEKS